MQCPELEEREEHSPHLRLECCAIGFVFARRFFRRLSGPHIPLSCSLLLLSVSWNPMILWMSEIELGFLGCLSSYRSRT